MKKKISLFLLFISPFLFAQEYIYKEIGLNEGLPSTQAYDMYQDKNGVIWFATDRGIAAYNGYEFRQFGINDGLLSNVVLGFFPQKDGKIYCSTFDKTLFYFEEDFKGFKPYKYNHLLTENLLHNQIIQNVYFTAGNELYMSCNFKAGKLVINSKGEILENSNYFSEQTIENAVYEKIDGNILVYYLQDDVSGLKSNAASVPCKGQVIEFINLPGSGYTIFRDEAQVLILDKQGKIVRAINNKLRPIIIKPVSSSSFFIGYLFGGGYIMDIHGNVLESFLKDQSITNFLIDREGGYWFTTLYSGVFYIKNPNIRVYNRHNTDIPIYSLTKNSKNELYVGYDNGSILKVDTNHNPGVYYNTNGTYRSFLEFNTNTDDFLFFSVPELSFSKKDGRTTFSSKELPYVIKFSEPTEKGVLVSHLGGIRATDIKGNKPDRLIKVPFRVQDACYWKDDVYFASPQGVYVHTSSGRLIDLKKKNRFFSYRTDDIDFNEKRNELYLASLGKGLIIYNKNNDKVFAITKNDGLFSDIVNEVYIENENEIWVCTNSGLNKITFKTDGKFVLTGLKSSDGLLNDGISDVEVINGLVWIASKKGLLHAPKKLFDAGKNNTDYLLRIKKVLVNEKEFSIKSLQGLSHNQNRIEFNFEGVSLKREGNLIYKYKLEGLDKKWYYTKNRKVTYSSLPYGEYFFKVAVQEPGGIQRGSLLRIPVIIKAPFWKTGWFMALFAVCLISVIYFFFKLRVLSYNKDITRELLRILVKKIKPKDKYFVFKEAGKDIRVKTDSILYVKSSGNYIELVTENKTYIVRCKIGDFIKATPDPLEYLRIHRSYIIRIDKVEAKSKTEVLIKGEQIPVSDSYAAELDKLIF